MKKKIGTFTLLAIFALVTVSCAKLQARDNLNKGIKAFRDGRYESAVEYFTQATELDPELTNAELYLATAYAQQYIPGGGSPENLQFADKAIATFEKVLAKDPVNTNAIAGLAGIYQSRLELQKAREYYKKQAELEPSNPTPFYAVGSIDWLIVYDRNAPPPLEEQPPIVDEGLEFLGKALELDPDYEEAMTYTNLLYREKARLAATDPERTEFIAKAEEFFEKSMEARKRNAEKQSKALSGITVE